MNTSSRMSLMILFTLLTNGALAAPSPELQERRVQAINQYLFDLKTGNADDIVQLFAKKGLVASTSKGIVEAVPFFHAFLPQIKYASAELNQLFLSPSDENRIAIRFRYGFELKNGERSQGQYMDEFVFEKNSDKLSWVYMFENLNIS